MTGPAPRPLPDEEALICTWLAGRPEFAATGAAIGDRLPDGYNGTQLAVVVARIGGAIDPAGGGTWLDRPRIDIDCHGATKAAARDLTATIRALMAVARLDDHSAAGVVWCDTVEDVGPQWLADADYPQGGRYLLQYTLLLHPTH